MLTKIVKNHCIAQGYYHMQVAATSIAAKSKPGQFVMVRLPGVHVDPLLRRPFSVMDVEPDGSVHFLYRVVGRGTRIIAELKEDSSIDLLGPLGNGFQIQSTSHSAWLIGGGIGIPPLYFLFKELRKIESNDIRIFLGGRTENDIPLAEKFHQHNAHRLLSTDDGSMGFKGVITTAVKRELKKGIPSDLRLYACGPKGMLKAVSQIARDWDIHAQISMENYMGCGIGACLGCVTETVNGKKTVCQDGPVFNSREIVWN